jgi:hypothetical protein
LTAAEWLLAAPRAPGLHSFDEVVDSIVAKQPVGSRSNGHLQAANPSPISYH